MPSKETRDKKTASAWKRWGAPATVVVVVASFASGWGLYRWNVEKHNEALTECRQAETRLTTTAKTGETKLLAEARMVRTDQVVDAGTVTAFQKDALPAEPVKPATCQASQDETALRAAAERMDTQADSRKAAIAKAERAAKAVLASRDAKSLADAKAALKAKQDEGSARLAQTDGQVADDATRERLLQALDAAGKVSSSKPSDYQQAQAAIQAALDQVNASAQAKAEADAQAAQQPAPSYGGVGSAPSYRPPANRGGGGGGYAPAPAPAPAPAAHAAPQGGGSSAQSRLPPLDTNHHGCNPDGSCGIG
ncbi:hypothetical protein BACT_1419 [Bifidobacterium actinocoloniiforme DSM 22766]|uniref:Colicin transporter n=1 Tax=Bifidobacterium actinocoloniiforme DSM 22766 TaxID=1437605 RepID=A0A086Z2G2_9BIFI|nr:hypothetical protein [Bifidobacterium actinocoloniiforme]KFI40712.1 hypothetical protein BACT_1419 [Bifidobacterium actinocoloniiforme DSM 22766]